jgi:hypothetical protein
MSGSKDLDNTGPMTHELPDVDELTAHAASFRFMDNNPHIREQIESLITLRTAELARELEEDSKTGTFLVSKRNLRAIFAKGLHEAMGLMTLSMNTETIEEDSLERQFSSTTEEAGPITDTAPALQVEL